MDVEILSAKENPLMKRKEILMGIKFELSTPSKSDMQAAVSRQFRIEPTHVEIKKIITDFGAASGKVLANIWEAKEIPLYGKKEEKPAEEKQ